VQSLLVSGSSIPSTKEIHTRTHSETLFEAFLNQHDDADWARVVRSLLPYIHEVDRTGAQIWFAFFPLALARALRRAGDSAELVQKLQLVGRYGLEDLIDSSHTFLYGHRYWLDVKRAVVEHATSGQAPASLELTGQIRDVAGAVANKIDVDESLLVGITAVGFGTLQHVGIQAFKASPGSMHLDRKVLRRRPEDVLAARARDDDQGLFGFLRGQEKIYTVTYDENDRAAAFKLINTQQLTTAAANDKRDYRTRDPRCMEGEGPIPIQCRSGACGTCWVGVLGGAEKLSDIGVLEARQLKEFGYLKDDGDSKPLIRLACQAQAFGAVSIVIPPWNGVFGKYIREERTQEAQAKS
jgi:ferredoxin